MRRDIYTTLETAMHVVTPLQIGKNARVLDLGCGNGVFLQAGADVLKAQYPSTFANIDALAATLTGVDLSPSNCADAKSRLTKQFGNPTIGWDIRTSNALELDEDEKWDFVIGNPPWVRLHDLDAPTRLKLRSEFKTAKGAFDLCYLFIEKALRMLVPGGRIAIIVPRGIQFQPAAEPLRTLLTDTGKWSVKALRRTCFEQPADVDPAIFKYTKFKGKRGYHRSPNQSLTVFGDIATITNGVATGANGIFLVDRDTAKKWGLERNRLRPVSRGRNITLGMHDIHFTTEKLIWPYIELTNGSWQLDDLYSSPGILEYLKTHQSELTHRPRLKDFIQRHPSSWYRFIDPNRQNDSHIGMRIAMPIVFRQPAFAIVKNRRAVVLNSCIEIRPRIGYESKVITILNSATFWQDIQNSSRMLSSGYRRTSVTELQSTLLTNPLI